MLKYILKVFFLSLPKFQISGTCALSGARMNSGPRTLRSWSSLSVGHSTTSGRWHAGFFPLRSKLFKVYYNVPHTQLKWFAGNSSANMSRASPPRLIQSLTLWRKSRDRWKVFLFFFGERCKTFCDLSWSKGCVWAPAVPAGRPWWDHRSGFTLQVPFHHPWTSLEFHSLLSSLNPKYNKEDILTPLQLTQVIQNITHSSHHADHQAILAGRLAPGAHVIVTSRPHTLTYLQVSYCQSKRGGWGIFLRLQITSLYISSGIWHNSNNFDRKRPNPGGGGASLRRVGILLTICWNTLQASRWFTSLEKRSLALDIQVDRN